MEMIEIFTDGSSLGNPGPGGFGAIIRVGKKETIVKGAEPHTTNNRMEMRAVIEALKKIPQTQAKSLIKISSDSRLVISTMKQGWKRKQNLDLWDELTNLCAGKKIEWHWVKGHASHPENIRVDKIATTEAKKMQSTAPEKPIDAPTKLLPFSCVHCDRLVKGKLSTSGNNQLIRVDCERCGKFIKFAKHTKEVLKRLEQADENQTSLDF